MQRSKNKLWVTEKKISIVTEQDADVSIYSMHESKLLNCKTEAGTTLEESIPNYPPGIYVYKIKTPVDEQSGKFILH